MKKITLHSNPLADFALKVVAGYVVFRIGKKVYQDLARNSSEANTGTDPNVGFAQSIRQALNPSGIKILKNMDFTRLNDLYDIARQITDLDAVATEYKKNFSSSMYVDLQSDLAPDEYQKFLGLATKGKVGNKNYGETRVDIPKDFWVLTIADANVRSKPIYLPKYVIPNNVVKLVKKAWFLGATTGKFALDERANVVFVEFWSLVPNKSTGKNERKTFYVAKSQIELLSSEEKRKREKNEGIKLQVLAGLEGIEDNTINSNQELITIAETQILNEQFKITGIAPQNVILGFPIMTLNTGREELTKFETVQGLVRWVSTKNTIIRQKE